jgi:superfamily II DNA/RNA helicase
MYDQKRSKSRRYSKTSHNSGAKKSRNRGYSKGRYKSHWKSKNRRMVRQTIAHSMYISKAEDVKEMPTYSPLKNFSDFGVHNTLAKNISNMGYLKPTKIQDEAIPKIMSGKDILGIASTGSGKTGAFLIPMINKVLNNPNSKVLIVSPTRELASQIRNEFVKLSRNSNLRAVLVIGGESSRRQISILRARPQFVVATPGRLIDLEKRNFIHLNDFDSVVLDEVDQMLDMGFVTDIKMIISKLAANRQSLFFSATIDRKGEAIANSMLKSPVKVESHKQTPLKNIHRDIVKISSGDQKIKVLHELLVKKEFHKVLVFSRTKRGADRISKELRRKSIRVDALHGNKSQNVRSKVLTSFRQDRIDVLVATDVAARGIDIPDISHVINYDEPATYNDYIHRIGRTGRIGKKGTALTFVHVK